ncbi:hypothetical protein diail_1477 [Diaporthe ilicicola]|nr:hypothetical protein diail_1477 [Diaporthe ilicicola]
MAQSMCRSIEVDQAPPDTPGTANGYKVAIFCALPPEADSVMATFISKFKITFLRAASDTNAYSLGLIATHNVVLVHIKDINKSNTTHTTTNYRATFHNLKVALLVGICGGVPSITQREQVHLGDVIVSSGMELYDFGRQFPHRFIWKNDASSMPTRHSSEIKALLAKLATSHCRRRCEELIVTYLRDLENLDMFQMSEVHTLAKMPSPDVKFEKIASGDKVMKSGQERDAVASEMNIIAFEMEGAGVWDTFQGNCLVIKAACDYADSHKSKKWQRYAALTAASFTKAFLEEQW